MKKCSNPNCSNTPASSSGKFCNICGSPLVEVLEGAPKLTSPAVVGNANSKKPMALIIILLLIIATLATAITIILLKPDLFDINNSSAPDTVEDSQRSKKPSEELVENARDDSEVAEAEVVEAEVVEAEVAEAEAEVKEETDVDSNAVSATPLSLEIVQVDSSSFPYVNLYMNIFDESRLSVKDLNLEDFDVYELDANGKYVPANITAMRQMLGSDYVSVNLVLDKSGSMNEDNKMSEAQYAATTFLAQIGASKNDMVEITAFDDYVYVPQSFTNDYSKLTASIYSISPGGQTALYDAIYSALLKTNNQNGAKCVIVFTDGMENGSSYSYDDVVSLSQALGIPLYIIGIGSECDEVNLTFLAEITNGKYYSAQTANLGEALAKIYSDVYNMQREWYLIEYRSESEENKEATRQIIFSAKNDSVYSGESSREYIPVPIINQSFADKYKNKDYILDFTSSRAVTIPDLSGLSLAELRIARNEIFARYGRQFKDPLLNKWFYSKPWYLSIMRKYSPDDFDKMQSPLSKLEQDNAKAILDYENYIMDNERIFPQSSAILLTEYDVSLSKAVLRRSLEEMYSYAGAALGDKNRLNDVELYNVNLIESVINQTDIGY